MVWRFLLVSACLVAVAVDAEYAWNGSKWVWSEGGLNSDDVDLVDEGSGDNGGGGGGTFDAGHEDEEGDSWDEYGSGDDEEEETYNYDSNTYTDIYTTPRNPIYSDNVVEVNEDVYVDRAPPVTPTTTTTTTMAAPRDPSISSRPKANNRSTSFFAQPGTLAAVIGGAVVGLLCAILCVMFVVYRMRKKDEGSYALDEPKRSPTVNSYSKQPSREFYA